MSLLSSTQASVQSEVFRLLAIAEAHLRDEDFLHQTLADLQELLTGADAAAFFAGLSGGDGSHVYHHQVPSAPKINVKVEKNTRGFNYEFTVTGAESPDQALEFIRSARALFQAEFEPALPDARPVPTVPDGGV